MSHTPGPWEFGITSEGKKLILEKNGRRKYICSVQIYQTPRIYGLDDEAEREANARLIASAPELLEAGKEVLHIIEMCHIPGSSNPESATGKLRKAIAKAEGKDA